MKVVYHGHSFVEIEMDGGSVLIDPFVTGNTSCDVSIDDLVQKKITAIILTHGHDDHVGDTVTLSQVSGAVVICSYELGYYLTQTQGLTSVSTQGVGGGVQYEGFHVKFFQAWHGGGVTSMEHGYTNTASGIILSLEGKTIYHAGDTGLFGDMKLLDELYNIDIAFLPIGDRYTMGIHDAAIAASWVLPHVVVPVHYNTWDVIAADPEAFVRAVGEVAPSVNVEVMQSGDFLEM